MQALMSSGSFCGLMSKLKVAKPALEQARLTTLFALSAFANEFSPIEQQRTPGVAANAAPGSQAAGDATPAAGSTADENGWEESPRDKSGEGKDGSAASSTGATGDAKPVESKPQPG